ncbi:thiosulfate:glutathione sulfurtransferase [Scomber scombrus]|uniref:Thiosulfate:glutathione sulfurtransferase n=1 Tax=Scomber scombrus TaxID=13677 RepID=A0AAV1PM53_SCOSC
MQFDVDLKSLASKPESPDGQVETLHHNHLRPCPDPPLPQYRPVTPQDTLESYNCTSLRMAAAFPRRLEEEERHLRVQLSVNAHDRPWLQVAGLTGLHDAVSPAGAKFLPASVVTYFQLKTMLANHDVQLFDVRNPDEYQAGHIQDAVNIPLSSLEDSLKLSPERFQQKFEVRAPRKDDDNLVFHCKSGIRGSKALDIARQLGFSRARHYKGGYSEWAEREGK